MVWLAFCNNDPILHPVATLRAAVTGRGHSRPASPFWGAAGDLAGTLTPPPKKTGCWQWSSTCTLHPK